MIGIIADLLAGQQQAEAGRDIANAQIRGAREQQALYGDALQQLMGLYQPYQQAGTQGLSNLQNLYSEAQSMPTDVPKFQYSGTVQDFMDPSLQFQQDQARRSIEQSAVGQGGLMSGATAKALQDRAQNIGQMGYQQAFQNMQGDRAQKYQMYQNRLNQVNQMNQQRLQNLANLAGRQTGLGQYGTLGQAGAQQFATGGQAGALGQEFQGIGQRQATGNLQVMGALGQVGQLQDQALQLAGLLGGGR